MKRLLYFVIILSVFCCRWPMAMAVPAYPRMITIKTHNGKDVEIRMQGDEHRKFAITKDGYSIVNYSDGWWYAEISKNGEVVKSAHRLEAEEDESDELKIFKLSCPKNIIPASTEIKQIDSPIRRISRLKREPLTGTRKALVILMQYQDVAFKCSYEDFDRLFNDINYVDNGATGSVRDFYSFASQGQLDYQSDIYGPFTSMHPMRYYGGNNQWGSDTNPLELCREALANLPADMDFSAYDNNNDGVIDNVHIIYAGYGEEAGASADAIWAHESPHGVVVNNIMIAGYSCSPELRGNSKTRITNIGVICHELGHALGAMDYYDTNYGTGGNYEGTGNWDIMAGGSWNNDGKSPANFNPYVRCNVFGWNPQIELTPDSQIRMPRMEMDNSDESIVYRMETGSYGDFFLLENRQQYYFDDALPGEGLIIYHVHPKIEQNTKSNTVNATHPQCLYPVCASGSSPDRKFYGNINSEECPFPGLSGNNRFSSQSSPSAVAWDGSPSAIQISNIRIDETDGSVSFSTYTNPDTVNPTEPDVRTIYTESFEHGIKDAFEIELISGSDSWRTYKRGSFILNPTSIPDPTDGKYILMLYAPMTEHLTESRITGPLIDVVSGIEYTLSFDVYFDMENSSKRNSFKLTVEDDAGTCASFSLNKVTDGWQRVDIPLTSSGENIRYVIHASIYTGGIFVDNISLRRPKSAAINSVECSLDNHSDWFVYSVSGSFIGKMGEVRLSPGVYLWRHDGRTRKIVVPY